MTVKQ